ncbi:unnamed protein product [Bursaphelenchus okinawaensis]|uniref:Protein kinase domain-containing protein n=1 Tax=Bursaphelenchus okinawaensis TaxID=465554 RepID=A0A811L8A9_9BILA|nr:unnamed protein product [Bursaphelenchus okinawaensis]CAG9117699.1 unnamed protein product [Bursaphelenchus okinawaensis]
MPTQKKEIKTNLAKRVKTGNTALEVEVTQPDEDNNENEKFGYGQVVEVKLFELNKTREYMICEAVGEGGYSSVHLANDLSSEDVFVAVKCIDLTSPKVQRLGKQTEFEVEILQKLQHSDYVVQLLAVKTIPNQVIYIFMELGSDTLSKIFYDKRQEKTSVTTPFVVSYWTQILKAVAYIHKNDVLHCDIKLDNFVTVDGPSIRIKLIDFGCATRLSPLTDAVIRRKTLGTIRYMAPEYLKYRLVSKESDVWALGVVLYFMFMGVTPFKGTRSEARMAIINKEAEVSDVPDAAALATLQAIFQHDRELRPSCNKLLRKSFVSGTSTTNSQGSSTDKDSTSANDASSSK